MRLQRSSLFEQTLSIELATINFIQTEIYEKELYTSYSMVKSITKFLTMYQGNGLLLSPGLFEQERPITRLARAGSQLQTSCSGPGPT